MNAVATLCLALLLSSCVSPLADSASIEELPDAPTEISVNNQYAYTPDISSEKHPMHILNRIVLKNLKTGEIAASLSYSGPEWLKINVETEYEYSKWDPTVINEVLKKVSFSGTCINPGTYNPKLTLTTLNGTFVKEWQWSIEVSVTGEESMAVTFYSMQGGDSLSYTLTSPFSLTFPSSDVFSRDGYTLSGWAGALYECNQIVQLDYKPEGYIFYAHWVRSEDVPDTDDRKTVTFSYGNEVKNVTVKNGDLASRPSEPVRNGMAIKGWYTSPSGGNEWNFSNPVTADMTLYAVWAPHFSMEKKGQDVTISINSVHWNGYQHQICWDSGSEPESIGYSTVKSHHYGSGNHTATVVSVKGDHTVSSKINFDVKSTEISDDTEKPDTLVLAVIGIALAVVVGCISFPLIGLLGIILAAAAVLVYILILMLSGVL